MGGGLKCPSPYKFPMFDCPNCNSQTHTLIAVSKVGIKCPKCHTPTSRIGSTDLHMSAGNKYAPKMTIAEKNNIINRKLENGQVVYKDKRYSSRYTR
jgi:hypothetical protein